jgi:hypothetical protein
MFVTVITLLRRKALMLATQFAGGKTIPAMLRASPDRKSVV